MLTSITTTTTILLLSAVLVESTAVFLQRDSAEQILRSAAVTRRRRANSNALEELFPGDLERECYEERCSQEEAAEIFQSHEKTLEFWFRYTNFNPCATNPCVNGGRCTLEREDFLCLCPPRYHGSTCQLGNPGDCSPCLLTSLHCLCVCVNIYVCTFVSLYTYVVCVCAFMFMHMQMYQCVSVKVYCVPVEVSSCTYRNGGCLQYCTDLPEGAGVQCGCAEGFKLESDGQSCSKTVAFPCGSQQVGSLHRGRALWDLSDDTNFTAEADMILDDANFTVEMDAILEDTNVTMEMDTIFDDSQDIGFNWTKFTDERLEPRIVGGALEKLGGSPWQVLIRRADGYGFCGGTLVSDRWVVSAAHCFQQTAHHVTIGDYDKKRPDPGEQKIPVKQVVLHPYFHEFTMDSDVALLYLARPVVRGPTAIPACLPDPHLSKYLLKEDNRGLVTGWGATQYLRRSSRFLRKVALPVVNHHLCRNSTTQAT
ncbi:coagulation factor IX isoform X2 [Syngnathus scovelli]|uniref:coagulation factor IX isoform X2 n=1 Tax=Syngnathus scovelli TaxID=161590 RepID=UPI002110090C|nr:coagulation factor VII isoform X2 [Syngnathus scovelli]